MALTDVIAECGVHAVSMRIAELRALGNHCAANAIEDELRTGADARTVRS